VFSLLTDNEEFRGLCFNLMQATVYSFTFAQPLKPIIGRGRPYREQDDWEDIGPWEWGNSNTKFFSQYTAFPSFHATFYSAYCTVFMDFLGHRWAGPILGAFCFFQQPGHVHWLSDIVAGGIFGYWLGSSIVDNNEYVTAKKAKKKVEIESNTQLFIAPIRGGIALNLSYSF
jgi:membrane-associated phospholipid phosphatase